MQRVLSVGAVMAVALSLAAALGTAWAQTVVTALTGVSPVQIEIVNGDTRTVTLKL